MTKSQFRLLLLRFALLPLLALCAFVALISWQVQQIATARTEGAKVTSTILQCNRLLNSLVDEETGVRGYLISGDASFLEPYHAAAARVPGQLDDFARISGADTGLAQELKAIRSDFERFDATNHAITQPEASGNRIALLGQQKQAMDSLRQKLNRLTDQQSAMREVYRKKVTGLFSALPILAIVGGALVAFCVIWDGIAQFRRISNAFGAQIAEIEVQRNSLHTTLHSIGDAVIVCDAQGIITLFNPTAEAVTGWKTQDAVGEQLNRVFAIVNEYTREVVESPVDKVLRSGQIVGLANHTILIRPDGSEVSIDDSGAPIRDDKNAIVGVVLVFRDIQARRLAERELALRNAELESLLQNSPAGFATFDRSHRMLRINASLARMDGFPEEAHLGKQIQDLLPDAAPIFEEILNDVFREGRLVQREFTGASPHEPEIERQWLMWFYPVFAADSPSAVLAGAIVLDTTDRWHAQEALVRNEKLVAVGRLAASIAHEMNNPLTSVTNLLYLIACDETLNPTTRGYVDRANIELDRVSRMATQTLRFARRSMSPGVVDLEDVVQGILLLFSGRLSHAQIRVIQRRRKLSTFYGYSSEVVQLLTNLVSNAIDAVGSSGKIEIAIQNSRDWQTGAPRVAVTVGDTGYGIPAQYRKKIWEPFFTTKSETGTGLGLWLVDETVRKNGGSIRLRTSAETKHHGTVFRLLLPLNAIESKAENGAE
jgi:PAS domain S-box-containing protein